MSLQVCHCGWSKVTTYQGLRTHQGKMGCTPRGMKVEESEQQYLWGNVGFTSNQMDLRLDVYTSIKTDTTDYYSDMSLQVCHCGWSKVTTYQGLRIHQGKMGCTPKGMRIPKREQYAWKNQWEEVDEKKYQPAKRMTVKKENAPLPPSPPSTNVRTNSAATATIKEEYKSPLTIPQPSSQTARNSKYGHQLQDFSTGVQVNRSFRERPTLPPPITVVQDRKDQTLSQVKSLVRERPKTTYPATVVRPKEKHREDQTLSQNAPLPPSPPSTNVRTNSAATATIKEEPISPFATPQRSSQRVTNSKSGRQLQDFCTGVQVNRSSRERPTAPPLVTVVRPKEKDRKDETLSRSVPDSTSTNTQTNSAAAEATTTEDPESSCETAQSDFSTGMKVKELAQMFSATTTEETAVRPKGQHREERKLSQVKHLAQKISATTAQETAVQPKEKDREVQKLSQNVPDSTSATTKMNPASAEATTEEDPKSSCETAQLSDFSAAMKVKELAWMFSATTTQETAVRPKGKHREEQKLSQVRQDRIAADVKHKIQMREQKAAQGRSSVKACKGSLDAEWLEINSVFSEVVRVVEDAKQKSLDLSIGTLRTTTSTMMEQIHQKLEKLSSLELKWISKFAVDVKLDPTSAHRCHVSADGKKVRNERENQKASGRFGSVLGLNRLTSGRSYWEVVVSNQTGWELGVARGDANRRGKLSRDPDNGYWVTAHYEDEKYAAMTAPPLRLSLKEKPQKVGVFVDYEEGLVSFYDVTAQSHIYSFTECWFTGEIYPYFSLQLKEDRERADPLIISTVKHQ